MEHNEIQATQEVVTTVEHTTTEIEDDHATSTSTMLMNVWFQIINLCIFFFVFWKLFGKTIIKSVDEREELLANLKNAESKYEELLASWKEKFDELVKEWSEQKAKILEESAVLAQKKTEEVLEQADRKANQILEQAEIKASNIESELIKHHEDMVKQTAWSYLKKIFYGDEKLQNTYLEQITKGKLG